MKDLRIAFLPLVRTTFDVALASEMIQRARQSLAEAGLRARTAFSSSRTS